MDLSRSMDAQDRGSAVNGDQDLFPFDEFILKIHSRCNLACDYCYMYEMADQSWASKPKVMSQETIETAARAIAAHAAEHSLVTVSVVLHGGEPLLVGHDHLEFIARCLRKHIGDRASLRLGIQTNGSLIDERFLEIFHRWDMRVGISLDGAEGDHDRHRKYKDGRGSYTQVKDGISSLSSPRHSRLLGGFLCVVDLANNPMGVYNSLIQFDPPAIDFLLPHGNWSSPPPGRPADPGTARYADWLIPVFDTWYSSENAPSVRLFDNIIDLILGRDVSSESVGLAPVRLVVIESDGQIEQVDSLKSAYPGATKLGHRVQNDSLSAALRHPAVLARQTGAAALADACHDCSLLKICGGGQFTHRYRKESGFRNPSVYCPDLFKLISHISRRVTSELSLAPANGNPE
jgi:uncharacterized protein